MRSRAPWALLAFLVAAALPPRPADAAGEAGDDEVCQADGSCGPPELFSEDGIIKDIRKSCPLMDSRATPFFLWLSRQIPKALPLLQAVALWPSNTPFEGWGDEYTMLNYVITARIALGLYKQRTSAYVNVPLAQDVDPDLVRVEHIEAPHWDVDGTPNFYWFESIVPSFMMKHLYVPVLTCFYSWLRRLSTDTGLLNATFDDALDGPSENTWEAVLPRSQHRTKRDWTMAFYEIANSWDGNSLWPSQMTDFQTFWKHDEWDDRLEYAIAFHLIGSHRLESGSWHFENLPGIESLDLPFRIAMNSLGAFEVRSRFGRFGGDLYFNEEGLPVLLQTPSGELVMRGDKQWQYWKFVWRSTLITGITLVDHLHLTHFRASNLLARTTRVAMNPNFPMRRLMSIFTFGAIFVNMQAMHTLIGPNHLLHRATPFKKFTELAAAVPCQATGIMKDLPDVPGIKPLVDEDAWDGLHPRLKTSPYYADARLLMGAVNKFVAGVYNVTKDLLCRADGSFTDEFNSMRREILNETLKADYALQDEYLNTEATCGRLRDLIFKRYAVYIFIVTGFHRHVGFVGDYYADPHLATMSWREGEMSGRPRQHLIMTIINVFTSTRQPLLKEDYTHLFKGMEPDFEDDFVRLWRAFQRDLGAVEEEIDRRNAKREFVNINMSPKVLESAVSK